MILTRTPLRVSLVGGGTDLPAFYNQGVPGHVVSFTINKYIYIAVNKRFEPGIRVSYANTENVDKSVEIQHDIVRNTMEMLHIDSGVEIVSIADVTGKGTGLGSSSSFAVGLYYALCEYLSFYDKRMDRPLKPAHLASAACAVEIKACEKNIGVQDQYAAAFGGLNHFQIGPENSRTYLVNQTSVNGNASDHINEHMMLFYTGITRSSSTILDTQSKKTAEDPAVYSKLCDMANIAKLLASDLEKEKFDSIPKALRENWGLKASLMAGISNPEIDQAYEAGLAAGALGGKLCGAGGGGFLLFYATPDKHEAVRKALRPMKQMPFKVEKNGSKVIYMTGLNDG